jgi:hypothetical protein
MPSEIKRLRTVLSGHPSDTDLLRQALEALRQCQFTTPPAQRKIVNAAIAALRERLK